MIRPPMRTNCCSKNCWTKRNRCSKSYSSRTNCWKRTTNYSMILRRLMTNSTKNCSTSLPRLTNCWMTRRQMNWKRNQSLPTMKNSMNHLHRMNYYSTSRSMMSLRSTRTGRHWMNLTKRRGCRWSLTNCCSTGAMPSCWMIRRPTKMNCWTVLPRRSWTTDFRLKSSRGSTNCCSMATPTNCLAVKYYCCWKPGEVTRCLTKNQGPHCSKNCQTRNYWMANHQTSCSRAETRCSTRAPKMSCYTIRWRT